MIIKIILLLIMLHSQAFGATTHIIVDTNSPQTVTNKTIGSSTGPTVDIITKGPWVDIRAYGAVSGGSTTVNDKAFLDIINEFSTDHGGIGYVTIFVPTGHFKTSNSIEINTNVIKVSIVCNSWQNSIVEHVGPASNGAIHVSGEISNGTAQGSNWIEIKNCSIGSTNGHGIFLESAANARLQNLEIFSAGSAANTAFIRITKSSVVEGNNIRLGTGNLLGSSGNYAPWNTVVFTYPPHAIYATNSATSLVTELHFSNVQLHTHITGHAVRYETISAPIGSFFGNTFNDCEFKLNSSESSGADYYVDGAEVSIFNSVSENVGVLSNITVKGTYDLGSVNVIGFNGNHGTFDVDQSNFGAYLRIINAQLIARINLVGTPGSYKIVSSFSQYDGPNNTGSPLIESVGDMIGTNFITGKSSAPTFYEGSGSNATLGIFPFYQSNAAGANLLLQKYRGSVLSPSAITANDSMGILEWDGYVNGALQAGGYLNLFASAVTASDITGRLDFHLRNGVSGDTIGYSITPTGAIGATIGTTTNDAACAGCVGEVLAYSLSSGSAITTASGATKTVISGNLTAGQWDCAGMVNFVPNAATSITQFQEGISTTTNTLDADNTYASDSFTAVILGAVTQRKNVPLRRLNLASTTPVYLVMNATYSINAMTAFGTITCERVR